MVKDKLKTKKNSSVSVEKSKDELQEQSKIWQDERFQHLVTDPRFKSLPKAQRKVKIDKRFQSMFTDKKFKVKYTVDKYGRRVNTSNSEDLRKYYELDENSDSEDEEKDKEEEERRKEERAISRDTQQEDSDKAISNSEGEPDANDELDSDGEVVSKALKKRLFDPQVDYARGEGRLITDSSSDDESSEDEDDLLEVEHVWGELDANAETTDRSTNRLALLNMDWDRIRAVDIMMLLTSFLPPGGSILSVKIYPSEFGKERLAEEEVHGPQELVGLGKTNSRKNNKKHKSDDDDNEEEEEELVQEQDSDVEEGDDYHMEKLRQYQLNRLRYYYGVVECDTVETADKIYKECDGLEYESSATRIDLRFIPDNTNFDEDEPTDVCNDMPDANTYKPRQFTTTALQQAKVDLTWDETAVERRELGDKLATGKLDDVSDKDLRKIVAYSSEEEEDDNVDNSDNSDNENVDNGKHTTDNQLTNDEEQQSVNSTVPTKLKKKKKENSIDKYRALLAEISEKEEKQKKQKYEMEFTWDVAADAAASAAKDDKDIDTKNKSINAQLTPIEKVLHKRSEKNKKRKEEQRRRKLQAQGIDPDEAPANDSDSDIVPDGIDMNDPYFAEEFANGDYEQPKSEKKHKNKKTKQKANSDDEETKRQANELALLLDDDDGIDGKKQHFNLDKIMKNEQQTKSKRKRQKQLKKSKSKSNAAGDGREDVDNFQINLNDQRFNAIYTSSQFNIDPTDSHYKKTKAMEQIIQEKLKRRHAGDENGQRQSQSQAIKEDSSSVGGAKRPRKQVENTLLVKSLKRKLQAHK